MLPAASDTLALLEHLIPWTQPGTAPKGSLMLLPWCVPSVSPTPATGQRPTFPLLFSRLLLCASCHNSPPLASMAEACGEGYGFITGETSTPGQAAWSKVTPSLCLSGPPD